MNLEQAIGIDALVVLACGLVILRSGHARFTHPGILYLFFHISVFSLRALAISNGSETFLGATPQECARALNLADLALASATVGWLSSVRRMKNPNRSGSPNATREIRLKTIVIVGIFTVPYGLYTLLRFAYVPGFTGDDSLATSSYETFSMTWPGLVLSMLIFRLGFRWQLMVPMFGYLGLMAIQGESRFRVVLPLILLMGIYLDRRGMKWPRLPFVAAMLAAFLMFFPLKTIGQDIQANVPVGAIAHNVQKSFFSPLQGDSDGQRILDQAALSESLASQRSLTFYGKPYLNVLVLPIPRLMWPEKPGLADHLAELQTMSQPIGQVGSVTTMVGDFYINFRLPGVIVLSFILAFASGRLFSRAYARPSTSILRFTYLVIAAATVQIARDNPISIAVFVLVHGLPYVAVVALTIMGPPPEADRTAQRANEQKLVRSERHLRHLARGR